MTSKTMTILSCCTVAAAGGIASGAITPDGVISLLSTTAQSEIAQAGFFFTLAAWLHSGRVRKEIRNNMEIFTIAMSNSINNVADALKADMATKASRQEVQEGFDKVNKRIDSEIAIIKPGGN